MSKKIPDYIIDNNVRLKLVEINEHISVLEKAHKGLMEKAKTGKLTSEDKDLLNQVIEAYKNLNKQFDQLAPSLPELLMKISEEDEE